MIFLPSPHPINSITQAQPLSLRQTEVPIHPNLKDVNCGLHADEVCGMIDPITGDTNNEDVYNRKSFLSLNKLIESSPVASPAAGNASADCAVCGGVR